MNRFTKLSLLIFGIFISCFSFSQPPGYNFGKQILIDGGQVSGTADLIDFPMLFQVTDNDLRHVSNGGSVESINGYDIVFYVGDCSTPLNHELEFYDPVTGTITAWVQINVLSATANTGIHMYYGNAAIAADPSTTATWSAGYDGVWHLQNPTTDASGSGNTGVNNGSTNISPALFEDGQGFVDPNHWIELPSHAARGGGFSYSAWINSSDVTRSGQRIICDDASNGAGCHAISLGDPGNGRIRFYIRGMGPVSLDSPNLISNNIWYYVVAVYDAAASTKYLYINGVLSVSSGVGGTLGPANGNASIGGEVAAGEAANRFMGNLDEVRSFGGVLGPNWIATEYNNQSNPSSFYAVSAQFDANNLCALLPIELINFNAQLKADQNVEIHWTTASEVDNDYFEVLKSKDGQNWSVLEKVESAGNSSETRSYEVIDPNPFFDLTYYKLKQTDLDGAFTFSDIRSVNLDEKQAIKIYPIPSNNKVIVENVKYTEDVSITDIAGKKMNVNIKTKESGFGFKINVQHLSPGWYIIQISNDSYKFLVK